jgi:hypothetical protein
LEPKQNLRDSFLLKQRMLFFANEFTMAVDYFYNQNSVSKRDFPLS